MLRVSPLQIGCRTLRSSDGRCTRNVPMGRVTWENEMRTDLQGPKKTFFDPIGMSLEEYEQPEDQTPLCERTQRRIRWQVQWRRLRQRALKPQCDSADCRSTIEQQNCECMNWQMDDSRSRGVDATCCRRLPVLPH